jgi:hypothetical protein
MRDSYRYVKEALHLLVVFTFCKIKKKKKKKKISNIKKNIVIQNTLISYQSLQINIMYCFNYSKPIS